MSGPRQGKQTSEAAGPRPVAAERLAGNGADVGRYGGLGESAGPARACNVAGAILRARSGDAALAGYPAPRIAAVMARHLRTDGQGRMQ